MGIEPTQSAWKAEILPLNYTRMKDGIGGNPKPLNYDTTKQAICQVFFSKKRKVSGKYTEYALRREKSLFFAIPERYKAKPCPQSKQAFLRNSTRSKEIFAAPFSFHRHKILFEKSPSEIRFINRKGTVRKNPYTVVYGFSGALAGSRTPDNLIKSQVLYLLSYKGIPFFAANEILSFTASL